MMNVNESDASVDVASHEDDEIDDNNTEDVNLANEDILEKLKSFRQKLNGQLKQERYNILGELYTLTIKYKDQIPNLRDIFLPEEIECIISDVINHYGIACCNEVGHFIRVVARSGYKDEPEVGEDGMLFLHRTTSIHRASKCGITKRDIMIRELLKIYNRFDVNYIDESGLTHFHAACMSGCEEIVKKFLEHGQDPNCLEQDSVDSPLHLALENKHLEVIELLLRNGANPNFVNIAGSTPLHVICMDYNDDMAELFFKITNDIQQTVEVDARDKLGNTPLHLALSRGRRKLFELLLKNGSDPNLADADGSTPLHIICKRENDADVLASMFFECNDESNHSVQVDACDKLGNTPLRLVLNNGNKKLLEFLLTKGANPNLADADGLTPLHIICKIGHGLDLVDMFFKICAEKHQLVEIDAQDNLGNSPLHLAFCNRTWHDYINLLVFLVRRGADPNLANNNGWTPVHVIYKTCTDYDDLQRMLFELESDKEQPLQMDTQGK